MHSSHAQHQLSYPTLFVVCLVLADSAPVLGVQSLLARMLQPRPEERATMEEVMEDPWCATPGSFLLCPWPSSLCIPYSPTGRLDDPTRLVSPAEHSFFDLQSDVDATKCSGTVFGAN